MRGTLGIIVTLLVLLPPICSSHAQGIRAAGFKSRGISSGIRQARLRTTGSGRQGMVSNFRGGISQVRSYSSFRGNSVGIGDGMANSSIRQRNFGRDTSNAGASFTSSSNLTRSTLGKDISNPQFQSTSASRKNTIAPTNRGLVGHGSGRLKKGSFRYKKDRLPTKTGRNYPSSNNKSSISRGLNNRLIVDKKSHLISKRLESNLTGNLKRRLETNAGNIDSFEETSTPSLPNRDIVHWVDGHNGVKHFSNRINSVPGDAKIITLVDGKKPSLTSVSPEATKNLRNSQSRFRQASFKSPDKTANLVIEKTADFPGQRPGLPIGRDHGRRDIHNDKHTKGFHHKKKFDNIDHHRIRHDHFRHSRFFPLDPFIFNNSFFFISPVFPLSNFFFNPFVFHPPAIFPSRFFGFQPFFVPAGPVLFIPVSPQFTTFTPFIDPFLLNPFFSPFLFGTDFFSTSIAFNNFR